MLVVEMGVADIEIPVGATMGLWIAEILVADVDILVGATMCGL